MFGGNYFGAALSVFVFASSFVSRLLYIIAAPTIVIKTAERIAAKTGSWMSVLGI